jgi:hypothetical protein
MLALSSRVNEVREKQAGLLEVLYNDVPASILLEAGI